MMKIHKTTDRNAGEDVGRWDPSFTVDEITSWSSYPGNQWRILKKLKMNIAYNPTTPLLCTHPADLTPYSTDSCSVMVIASVFRKARKWEQSKCPSTGELLMKIQYA